MSKYAKNSIFNCEGSAWLPGLNNVSKYIKYKKNKPPRPLKSTLLLPPTWYRFGAEKGAGNPEWLEGFRITKGAGIEMIFFSEDQKKKCVLRLKMSFHIIPMYVFSVVLFRTSQISASGLVPSTYIVTRKRSNQNIDCWHKPTSLLHVCAWVQLSMIAHKALVAKMIKVVLERAHAHCLAVEVEHVSGNEFKEQVIYGLFWLASCPFSNLLNILILKLH